MRLRRINGRLQLQLTPGEIRGLWVGLVLSFLFLVVFAGIGYFATRGPNRLTEFDEELGLRLEEHRLALSGVRKLIGGVTYAGSVPVMAMIGVVFASVLWWRRERLMALALLAATAGGGALNLFLKKCFARDRPPFKDPSLTEHNQSFPSGHSMGAVIGYGLIVFVMILLVGNRTVRVVAITVFTVVVLLVGYSRIYLGAHYFSDVMGGYAAGAAWLAAWVAFMQTLRHHPPEIPPEAPPSVAREKVGA
jgi:undecaprenyl-diphosphatase